jgi:hypothetical protein
MAHGRIMARPGEQGRGCSLLHAEAMTDLTLRSVAFMAVASPSLASRVPWTPSSRPGGRGVRVPGPTTTGDPLILMGCHPPATWPPAASAVTPPGPRRRYRPRRRPRRRLRRRHLGLSGASDGTQRRAWQAYERVNAYRRALGLSFRVSLSTTSAFGAAGSGVWLTSGAFGHPAGQFLTTSTRGQSQLSAVPVPAGGPARAFSLAVVLLALGSLATSGGYQGRRRLFFRRR